MYEVGRQLYVPGLGSLISTPNIFFQNGPEHGFFDRSCHCETSGHLIRRGQD
jgi:hypothetical protein